MINLRDKETGNSIGTIQDEELQFLIDQLEEESASDTDYYLNAGMIDALEQSGGSPDLLRLIRDAMGDREGIEIQWEAV